MHFAKMIKIHLCYLLFFELYAISLAEDTCIMYGQCGSNPLFPYDPSKLVNCYYKKSAKPLEEEASETLKTVCPEFYNTLVEEQGDSRSIRTCCDPNQVNSLKPQLLMVEGLLKRCPTCVSNFREAICNLACSPHQSAFMHANATEIDNKRPVVTELDFYMNSNFADRVYKSCKDVALPSVNAKSLSIMCGPWGAYYCTGERLFSWTGSTKNGFAPFQINYRFSNKTTVNGFKPFNVSTLSCNQAVSGSFPCGCMDCQDSCPSPAPQPSPPKPFLILNIDGLSFIMGTIFTLFVTAFLSFWWLRSKISGTVIFSEGALISRRFSLRRIGVKFDIYMEKLFTSWATFCAEYPWTVINVGIIFALGLSVGILFMRVTTDPVHLWASPTSRSRVEKGIFDQNFGPFFRTEMLIIRPVNETKVPFVTPNGTEFWGPAFNFEFLQEVIKLQNQISGLTAEREEGVVTLKDICFEPLFPDNDNCVIQSVANYFQNDLNNLNNETYLPHIQSCMNNPLSPMDNGLPCLGEFGGPVFPFTAFGGFLNGSKTLGVNPNYKDATALIMTFVVRNSHNKNTTSIAEAWESIFLKFMSNFSHPMMDISYSAERSIQDELERQSKGDVAIILISYVLMLAYISIALGNFNKKSRILLDSKFTLGLGGVLIVLLSVSASVGVFGFFGFPATLIIIEVVPFLVLAVGVDNMFILVQAYQREERRPSETRSQHIGRVVGRTAPSVLVAAAAEVTCFFLGALSDMPAVHVFALYAGMALAIDFLLQMTCFISLISLDAKRYEKNRLDVLCCINLKSSDSQPSFEGGFSKMLKENYSKFLLSKPIRVLVIISFFAWFCVSVASVPKLEVGLDQELAMPEDSYVLKYFKDLGEYLSVGPPMYLVVKGDLNFSTYKEENSICSTINCDPDSLMLQIYSASLTPNYTYIARPATSWLDDYMEWSIYQGDVPCCRVFGPHNKTFCPATNYDDECFDCDVDIAPSGVRPTAKNFMEYLPFFLQDNPGFDCPKGGHAAYGDGVKLNKDKTSVEASYFMTYHTILKTSQDFTLALQRARTVASNISLTINKKLNGTASVEVFPYSVFYVFYEQYLTMWHDTFKSLSISVFAVFLVTFFATGFDLVSALIIVFTIIMITVDLCCLMFWWGITLNAISLVNLVMCVGISVEFCSHITLAFARCSAFSRLQRANDALVTVGISALSQITMTNFVGILVLAFAHSRIFRIFYFRMYLGIFLIGASHGLIFLPVVLSFIGPSNRGAAYEGQVNQSEFQLEEKQSSALEDSQHHNPSFDAN